MTAALGRSPASSRLSNALRSRTGYRVGVVVLLSRVVPVAAIAAILFLVACAGASAPADLKPDAPLPAALRFDRPVVLLGEVHDNAEQHALRLRAFRAWLVTGARPALAMEQFDRPQQAAIDRELAKTPRPSADALIAAAQGSPGWHWPYYKPFIELALAHRLPILAANVPREQARAVMRQGLQAQGFDPLVPPDVLQQLTGEIEASHCGQLPPGLAPQMALSQVARDQFMAQLLTQHAHRGVLLLAGNGHVRTDVGAPYWLNAATRQRSLAIGVLEQGDTSTAFDRLLFTAPQPRPDPCAGMAPVRR